MTERLKILVLSTFDGTDANVTQDFLFSFNAHSKHLYYYVFDCRILDDALDLSAFDAIILFWSIDLLGPDLSDAARARIAATPATKIAFLQDEYRDVHRTNDALRRLGVRVILTCVAESDHDVFYPRDPASPLRAVYTVLPGYVPRYLEGVRVGADTTRPLDIGYRSRAMPFYLGDLGQDKRRLAERFTAISRDYGLRGDISVREDDRLYGRRWLRFLLASRCVLGSPSGASVVDFTGNIRRNCERHLALNPQASYDEVKALFFADVDWKVVIDTVSPRVFESAALRCTMVQHEGRYGGLLEPDRHYIRVNRDYSNVGEVVDRLRDRRFCRRLADNAYRDLIGSGQYSYRAFAAAFDRCLAREVPAIRSGAVSLAAFYARAYLRHGQAVVPYGNRFLVLPSRALAFDLMRRLLARLPHARFGPVMSRLIRNPRNVGVKGIATVAAVLRTPGLRLLAARCLRAHRSGRPGFMFGLLDDLRKLDLVHRARSGTLVTRQSLDLVVDFDRSSGVLILRSCLATEGAGDRPDLPEDLRDALSAGKVQLLLWDHSSLGQQIVYGTGWGGWLTASIGVGGIHRFDTISPVARTDRRAAAALLSLLRRPPLST